MAETVKLTVREIQESDIPLIIAYWQEASADFLRGMGVDLAKLPSAGQWQQMLEGQLAADYPQKQAYAIILEADGKPVGHCNVNKIQFGEEAFMHLHLWESGDRQHGYGTELVRMAIPFFFNNLRLKRLFCEPYALNPAPNRTLPKLGFRFAKSYVTTPGFINFEQEVNLWVLEK